MPSPLGTQVKRHFFPPGAQHSVTNPRVGTSVSVTGNQTKRINMSESWIDPKIAIYIGGIGGIIVGIWGGVIGNLCGFLVPKGCGRHFLIPVLNLQSVVGAGSAA